MPVSGSIRASLRKCSIPMACYFSFSARARSYAATCVSPGSALVVTGIVAALLTSPAGRAHAQQPGPAHPLVSQAEYQRWQTELSNWGRWGKDDELGTLN